MTRVEWRVAIPWIVLGALAVSPRPYDPREIASAAANEGWSKLTMSMDAMHRAMRAIAPSGDLDEDFVRLMLPHHRAALEMAKTELLLGKSREMRRLAQEIIADQQSEIELMERWLKNHVSERPKAGDSSAKEE